MRIELEEMYKRVLELENYGKLSHFFVILDNKFEPSDDWQVGLYNSEKDKVKSFKIKGEKVEADKEAEVFKKPGTEIQELNLEEVKLSLKEASKIAKKVLEENFVGYSCLKVVCILQNFEGKDVWNFTIVTGQFKTLNIKINSRTGSVEHQGVIDFFNKV